MASVLYVGDLSDGGTCAQRLRAMKELGHEVRAVPTGLPDRPSLAFRAVNKLFGPLDVAGANGAVLKKLAERESDVLWLDKALSIRARTLAACKAAWPRMLIVGYSPDDMYARHNQSRHFRAQLPLYDAFFTTKSYGVRELQSMGCRRVHFVDNAFDPATHRPMELTAAERERWGGPVGFVGTWEEERAAALARVAASGIPVRVWGNGWERARERHPLLRIEGRDVVGDDYARAINAFDINLAFLRKRNRDLQTTRSIEIPACGAFMLAERTAEHEALFREGVEAEYFADDAELIGKVHRYAADAPARQRIAAAGRERCLVGGYSNHARIAAMFDVLQRQGTGSLGG